MGGSIDQVAMRSPTMRSRISKNWFANSVGLKINLLYKLYTSLIKASLFLMPWRYFKLRRLATAKARAHAKSIEEQGFTVVQPFLSPETIKRMSDKFDALIGDGAHLQFDQDSVLSLKDAALNIPEFEELLMHPDVSSVLSTYYKSFFKAYRVHAYRLQKFSGDADDYFDRDYSAQLWHLDKEPGPMIRIFVYLKDTTVKNAAVHAVNKEITHEVLEQGFTGRHSLTEPQRIFLEKHSLHAEGKAGTVIIFRPQDILHKADQIKEDLIRDTFAFHILPAFTPFSSLTSEQSKTVSRNVSFCSNPFTNQSRLSGQKIDGYDDED